VETRKPTNMRRIDCEETVAVVVGQCVDKSGSAGGVVRGDICHSVVLTLLSAME